MSKETFNTVIGQAARGDKYFQRTNITNEIWRKLKDGSNLLLVAPRRVGKSSILLYLFDNPEDKLLITYYTSESVNNENEFYKKLFHHIIGEMTSLQRYKAIVKTLAKAFPACVDSIGPEGIKFKSGNSVDYCEELRKLMQKTIPTGEKIIVLIDEFASTVENITQDEDDAAAIHFLETKRSIRQDPAMHNKLQFIYAGSIGLENIVGKMNQINLINDLAPIAVPPLTKTEARNLIDKIFDGSGITLSEGAFEYLLDVIEWWIPFYFQIILDESYKIVTERGSAIITKDDIQAAVKNALKQRIYFENWFVRLRKAYKANDFSFVKEVLNVISEEKKVPSSRVFDCAVKYGLEHSYTDLVNTLKHDGYINNNDNPKEYRFNSSLLREWWWANVAN
ncbi:MAG: ATP-binding protein [Deltaproteobacteria bacterium]